MAFSRHAAWTSITGMVTTNCTTSDQWLLTTTAKSLLRKKLKNAIWYAQIATGSELEIDAPGLVLTSKERMMALNEYHKINTVFKRDRSTNRIIEGDWTIPEFEYLAANLWAWSEKVDGTNIRVIFKDGGVTFGGRTEDAQIPAQLVTRLNERFLPMAARLAEVFPDGSAVLYGEGYGAKIQKGGGNYRPDQDFVLFDAKCGEWMLQRADVEDVAAKLGIDIVPIIGEGTLHDAVTRAKEGIRSTWGDFQAEGIVARPKTELKTRSGQRLIAKIKCRDFANA